VPPHTRGRVSLSDVWSTFHQSLSAVAGETCSTNAGDCAAGFVCECGVLNPVVAVEIKVTLGGYTSLTFGDTEKGAFRQGLPFCDRETYPERDSDASACMRRHQAFALAPMRETLPRV